MRKIIKYFKDRADRKLRERCVKYACQYGPNDVSDTPANLAKAIYGFITKLSNEKVTSSNQTDQQNKPV